MTRADGPWGPEWPSQAPVGCSLLWHCGPAQARDLPFPGELSSTPKPDNMEIPSSVPPPLLEKSLSSRLTWLRCIIEPAPTGKALVWLSGKPHSYNIRWDQMSWEDVPVRVILHTVRTTFTNYRCLTSSLKIHFHKMQAAFNGVVSPQQQVG